MEWWNVIGIALLGIAALIQIIPLAAMNEALAKSLGLEAFERRYRPPLGKDMAEGRAPTQPQFEYQNAKAIQDAIKMHDVVSYVTIMLVLFGTILSY